MEQSSKLEGVLWTETKWRSESFLIKITCPHYAIPTKTKFGDIIDCIDINKQPAFDHPLLKNHKLQCKNSWARLIFGLEKHQYCPTGTVPIQRITKDDLIRDKLLNSHTSTQSTPGDHFAEVSLVPGLGPYYGVSGSLSIYNPKVEKDQSSASVLWVRNEDANRIVLGWHVNPSLYGDDATHIYSRWTRDNYQKTGCFNMQCPGFVQTNKRIYLGTRVDITSIYGGRTIETNVSITQDPITKNWWLNIENTNIGYFPIALFSNMASAQQGGWGGKTHAPPGAPSPPMGSGYFPDKSFIHACYFRDVSFKNGSTQNYGPEEYHVNTETDKPSCFGVKYYGNQGRQLGYSLQFGGPVINGGIHKVHGIQNTLKEDLELERQQQLINKPHIKSIRTKFGEIIDCIDINKQPAFDHPLLKNHKLQRKPNFKISSVKDSTTRFIFGLKKDQYCPTGTVPIQRITKEDLIGDKLLNSHTLTQSTPGDHFAEVSLVPGLGPYYGVSGSLSIYNPKVEKDQISSSTLWVQNGDANRIEFGWHVNPRLYGDDKTHIYSRWTSDNYKKIGCFNMQCPGFVQTHKGIYLGTGVDNTSIHPSMDPITKSWWLSLESTTIGYFPIALFSNLALAEQGGWGGRTHAPPGSPSPPMGSGYFSDAGFVHACYFRQVSFKNGSIQDYGPEEYHVQTNTDNPSCFGVEYYGNLRRQVGYSLQFGGPGGNCGN
ncbi:hypothetical protein GmHk_14G042300 [Glycine max]|nr:hypothetical protein GmHk_14G042300 [Glycine max]